MATISTDQFYDKVTLNITTKSGKPAKVDGVPVWASSDETVLAPAPNADGMTGAVSTVAPGVARITFSADADLGPGVTSITLVTEDITVTQGTGGQASVIAVDLGTPVDKV